MKNQLAERQLAAASLCVTCLLMPGVPREKNMLEEYLQKYRPERDTLVTIGNFDGVHLGHQHLLQELVRQAQGKKLLSAVITFDQHPDRLFRPEKTPAYLTDPAEKVRLLKAQSVAHVIILPFTRELAESSACVFTGKLQRYLRMKGLVVGPDFALGKGRAGTAATLKRLGEEMGFSLTIVPPLVIGGEVVSSTVIREALSRGDVAGASRFLGRPFSLRRRVIPGAGRGVKLGYPTANLDVEPEQALPANGVYASFAFTQGKKLPSITYIGKAPTFGNIKRSVETYIFDFNDTLYGRELKIDIILRLRSEKRFRNAGELKEQIEKDVEQAGAVLEAGRV